NGKEPFLSFDTENNRYSASGGCNGLGGTVEVKGKEIEFAQGMSTLMACPDMQVEDGFKRIFGQTVRFSIEKDVDNDILVLQNGKKTIAKFKAQSDETNAQLEGTWELDYISGPRIAFAGLYPNKKPILTFDMAEGRVSG